ncbi:MAG: hypothetical protein RXP91_01275 [Nitrososphaeria archaeon]
MAPRASLPLAPRSASSASAADCLAAMHATAYLPSAALRLAALNSLSAPSSPSTVWVARTPINMCGPGRGAGGSLRR